MTKKTFSLLCVTAMLMAGCAVQHETLIRTPDPVRPARSPLPVLRGISRIVIDPGHGGKDPGALGKFGIQEKNVVLDYSRDLAAALRRQGFEVLFTREKDVFVALEERAAFANRMDADIFLSVHANASRKDSACGFEIFICRENDARGVWSARQNYSEELAHAISSLVRRRGIADVRRIKTADFRVLRLTTMPAVLIEIGFITNKDDRIKLQDRSHKEGLINAIVDGIIKYDSLYAHRNKR